MFMWLWCKWYKCCGYKTVKITIKERPQGTDAIDDAVVVLGDVV